MEFGSLRHPQRCQILSSTWGFINIFSEAHHLIRAAGQLQAAPVCCPRSSWIRDLRPLCACPTALAHAPSSTSAPDIHPECIFRATCNLREQTFGVCRSRWDTGIICARIWPGSSTVQGFNGRQLCFAKPPNHSYSPNFHTVVCFYHRVIM